MFPKHVSFGRVFGDGYSSNWTIGLHIERHGLIPSSLRVNHFSLLWGLSAQIAHSTPIDGEIASPTLNCHLPPWSLPLHLSIQLFIFATPYLLAIIKYCRHYWVFGPPCHHLELVKPSCTNLVVNLKHIISFYYVVKKTCLSPLSLILVAMVVRPPLKNPL